MQTKINTAGFKKPRIPRKRKKVLKKSGLYDLIKRLNSIKNYGRYATYKAYKEFSPA